MYICLEGIDGAGKSTQIELLERWLIELGYGVTKLVEPSSSSLGLLIRKMLKDPRVSSDNFQKALGLLFAADRMLLVEKIRDEESKGKIIISDRCFYSSIVYQSPSSWIKEINTYARKPDLVFLLDLDVERAVSRCRGHDQFEKKTFLKKVKKKYLKLAEEEDFMVINANTGVNMIHSQIKKILAPHLGICDTSIR